MAKNNDHVNYNHEQNISKGDKINNFLAEHRKMVVTVLAVIVIALLVLVVSVYFIASKKEKNIQIIESTMLSFDKFKTKELKNSIDELTSEEKKLLEQKQTEIIDKFQKIAKSNDYSGFMANMEIAEIYHARKDWENALKYYMNAGNSIKTTYSAGSAYFNAGICAEQLNDFEQAIDFYEKSSKIENFPFRARSLFNVARIQENIDQIKAIETYNKVSADYPDSEWGKLSKTRVIQLSLDNTKN